MTLEVKCDHCSHRVGADSQLPRADGWLTLIDEGDEIDFCSWPCLKTYAEEESLDAAVEAQTGAEG